MCSRLNNIYTACYWNWRYQYFTVTNHEMCIVWWNCSSTHLLQPGTSRRQVSSLAFTLPGCKQMPCFPCETCCFYAKAVTKQRLSFLPLASHQQLTFHSPIGPQQQQRRGSMATWGKQWTRVKVGLLKRYTNFCLSVCSTLLRLRA